MKLKVKPLKSHHANKSRAAIDPALIAEHNIDTTDFLKIENTKNGKITYARAWSGYEEDKGDDVIRIDGVNRKEADVDVDEFVRVSVIDINVADSVTISIPSEYANANKIEESIHAKLEGKPINEGKGIALSVGIGSIGGNDDIPVEIVNISPNCDAAVIHEETEINVVKRKGDEDNTTNIVSDVMYEDIGGLNEELEKIREMVELPMRHPELFEKLGIDPPRGLLLHGPPGTGKTLLAEAVANEVDANLFTISGPEIMGRYYGESEEELREVFEQATEQSPSIIFMDEFDSIGSKRGDSSGDVERRIVAQLLSLMDGLEERNKVFVIGATNRVDSIDPALRRGGRFDREIEIGVPDKQGRREILAIHSRGMPLGEDVDLDEFSERTHGFVGADIESLCKESAINALKRYKPDLNLEEDSLDPSDFRDITVTREDFEKALRDIEPSALREVFVEVPDVSWSDVGGLNDTKDRLKEVVQWPLNYEEVFADMKLESASGVMLYGPPGTGKTLLAKAVANESDSNFISIKGPELLNKYVGESEKGIREIFEKARSNAPTVVFFDEIDAIASERNSGESGVEERVVSQLLTELDGLEQLEDVVVIATTNRPDLIDSALLRPGRLDRHIHVPVPEKKARKAVLEVHMEGKPVADDVDLDEIAERAEGYVGADIEAVCREATMEATRSLVENLDPDQTSYDKTTKEITREHFENALDSVNRSVTEETEEEYKEIEEHFKRNTATQKDDSAGGRSFY